jgi:Kef-type K+ transport system membrane component KefB
VFTPGVDQVQIDIEDDEVSPADDPQQTYHRFEACQWVAAEEGGSMRWEAIQDEPTYGFTIVALIVVFGPLIAEKLRLPGILGLLIGGALIGPSMWNVLPDFSTLEAIGSLGVLYLIFLAGLQLDIESFVRYRRISFGFGLLTALTPLVLGTAVALALDIDLAAAILIGSFWASFTLIAYPTVSRLGLTRNRAVAATVGASSITDTISLVILALVIGAETGDSSGAELILRIALGLIVVAVWCFGIVPLIGRWFFTGLGQERSLRFMFLLLSLTSSAVIAEMVEIEPLIAAFFVGVGLNPIVPNKSPLMAATDLFGNAFFIPTFLVSVGLLFDPEVMFDWETIRLAIGFGAALFVGKVIAARVAGRIYGLTGDEVGLMTSISVAQAAATLAATVIGLDAGLYGDDIVNAVMVVVAVSLIATTLGTARFAPRIPPPHEDHRRIGEAVLLPAHADAEYLGRVVQLGASITEPVGGVLQPIVVATSTDDREIEKARGQQSIIDEILRRAGQDVESELRIDRSVGAGLNRAAIQDGSSMLLLAWSGPNGVRDWLFGADYQEIVAATALPIVIAALHPVPHGPGTRLVLVARDADRLPADMPSLRLAADVATSLATHTDTMVIGPLTDGAIVDFDIPLPAHAERRGGSEKIAHFAIENSEPGDMVIIPMRDIAIRSDALAVFEAGRSVLAVTHNPESQSALNASTLTLPVGATINPI